MIEAKLTSKRTTMTVTEAADFLGLGVSTLNKWRVYGGGPVFLKLGRAVRYRKADLEAYIDQQLTTSTSAYRH